MSERFPKNSKTHLDVEWSRKESLAVFQGFRWFSVCKRSLQVLTRAAGSIAINTMHPKVKVKVETRKA